MLPVAWNVEALDQLDNILGYIEERNPPAALRIRRMVDAATERIAALPRLYRPGRVPATREAVVHPNYILVYRVEPERVVIVAVLHTRQQYP